MKKTVLVTGATCNIGSYIIPQLIKGGAAVRAFVRNASRASALRDAGAEIIEGDFVTDDVETTTGRKTRSFQQFYDEIFSYALKS
jgi:nucleoside-diphosphate-sugar epimerase